MRLVRESCPNPIGKEGTHGHWSLHCRGFIATWSLWLDYDRRMFGCPIEVNISTPTRHYLIRPFSKSQRYDWEAGKWSDATDSKNWRHVVSSPSQPEAWEKLRRG